MKLRGKWYTFKGDISVKIVLLPSEKGSVLKGKEFALLESKFFPFKNSPLSVCRKAHTQEVAEDISLVEGGRNYHMYPFCLNQMQALFILKKVCKKYIF